MTNLPSTKRNVSCRAPRLTRMRGISIVTAIFLVVVLAGLAAAMVRVLGAQASGLGLDAAGARAEQAARSGLEWGLYQQLRNPLYAIACIPNSTFAMPSSGSLASFTVTVTCTTPVDGTGATTNAAGKTTNRWTITAVACNAPGPAGCPNASANRDYVQRRVQAHLN